MSKPKDKRETDREIRRVRATVEIIYVCEPGEFVDIQADIWSDLSERDFRYQLVHVDLDEHVRLTPEVLA